MENEKYFKKYLLRNLLKWVLPILGILTLRIIIKFTGLHILYWPEEIPLSNHEYFLLFVTLIIFISSIYYKFKLSIAISFLSIILSLINIVGFSTAAVFYYRELYLNKFI